jgi:chemotaxis protein methyltransferase CheR
MKALGVASFPEYFDLLSRTSNRDAEIRNLLNEITVGETSFFRNGPQLNAIRKIILPKLVEARTKLPFLQLRIWSCGCSTGEEPYTLAMILLEESAALLKGWNWEIIATDLNDRSLETAREGVYDSYSLRNTAPRYIERYFAPRAPDFAISNEVKTRVRFRRLNVLDEDKISLVKDSDIILCANVLIYFNAASKKRTVRHVFNSLRPGGYFFLGHSESLYGVSDAFRLVHFPGATAYMKSTYLPAGGGPK